MLCSKPTFRRVIQEERKEMSNKRWMLISGLVLLAALALVGCGGGEAEVITVIVEGAEGETIVETVIIEAGGAPEGPLMADEGLIDCLPLPEGATGYDAGTSLAAPMAPAVEVTAEDIYGELTLDPPEQGGDVLRIGTFSDVTDMNFFSANGPNNTVYNSYMLPPAPGMFGVRGLDFAIIPDLAAMDGVPTPEDDGNGGWFAEITLRDDVTWSDGEPFTADDIVFTGMLVLDTGFISGNFAQWYDANFITSIEAVDDYTVRYNFSIRPGLGRWDNGMAQAPILAEHFWAPLVEAAGVLAPIEALDEDPAEEDLIAAQSEAWALLYAIDVTGEPTMGSFLLESREPGAFIQWVVNPDWYGADESFTALTPEGEEVTWEVGPFVDTVLYTIYADQNAAILAMQNDEIDFMLHPLGLQRGFQDQIEADPNLQIIFNNTNGYRYMAFNTRRRPMNDCSFRQAMTALIDKEYVANTVLAGVAFPMNTVVPVGNVAYHNPDVPRIGYGLTRAERITLAVEILENAGYTWDSGEAPYYDLENDQAVATGRLVLPDGTPVPDLELWAPNAGYDPLRATFGIHIESWLQEVGVPVTAHLAGFNILIPRGFTTHDFDFYILGWSAAIFPNSLSDTFTTAQAVPDGNNNSGYSNPDYDALAATITTCITYEECRDVAYELQNYLAIEVPYCVLFDTGIMEPYRPAALELPFYETLSGWQYLAGQTELLGTSARLR